MESGGTKTSQSDAASKAKTKASKKKPKADKPVSRDFVTREDNKKSYRRGWRSASPVRKLEIIFLGLAAAGGIGYLGVAVWGNLQTKWINDKPNGERAIVGLKTVTVRLNLKSIPNSPINEAFTSGSATVENFGKTQALDTVTTAVIWSTDRKLALTDLADIQQKMKQQEEADSASHSMMMPNTTLVIPLDRPFPLANYWAVQRGEGYLYIIGKVSYFDVFQQEKRHTTMWCGRYNPVATDSSDMIACPKGFEYTD